MRDRYIERRKADLQHLSEALVDGDGGAFTRVGHQLKGNAATYGFDELERIGIFLENAGHKNLDAEAARAALALFEGWLESVAEAQGEDDGKGSALD